MGFELMNKHVFEIDTTPEGEEPTYAPLSAGFNSAEPSNNEELSQEKYFDGDGYGETDVIGAQLTLSLSGHRKYGDPAQDFIWGNMLELGPKRRTMFRWTQPDGEVLEGNCTIANIAGPGGGAGEKGAISCEIHFNGKPTKSTTP